MAGATQTLIQLAKNIFQIRVAKQFSAIPLDQSISMPPVQLIPQFKPANAQFVGDYNNALIIVDTSVMQALLVEDAGRKIGKCPEFLCGQFDIPPTIGSRRKS